DGKIFYAGYVPNQRIDEAYARTQQKNPPDRQQKWRYGHGQSQAYTQATLARQICTFDYPSQSDTQYHGAQHGANRKLHGRPHHFPKLGVAVYSKVISYSPTGVERQARRRQAAYEQNTERDQHKVSQNQKNNQYRQ